VILSELLSKVKKRPSRKRCGRGPASGLGKTSGRGQKGASSRSGFKLRLKYEGGQVSLIRHMPKRGFTNYPFRKRYDVVNLDVLEAGFQPGDAVTLDALVQRGLLKPEHGRLKILGGGTLTKSLHVAAHWVSDSARAKIEAAGGKAETLDPPRKKRVPPKVKSKEAEAKSEAPKAPKGEGAKEPKAPKGEGPKEAKSGGPKEGKAKSGPEKAGGSKGGGKPPEDKTG
jgi:large subunit ribosomal protein L15